ncbi:hypothetical protein AM593_06466, partial [Mytilus galloprovincialis]
MVQLGTATPYGCNDKIDGVEKGRSFGTIKTFNPAANVCICPKTGICCKGLLLVLCGFSRMCLRACSVCPYIFTARDGDIALTPSYGVYISQLVRYAHVC